MARSRDRIVPLLVLALGLVLSGGCADDLDPVDPVLTDPETELTFAPLEGDTASYRIRFFWNGYDNDGEVIRFRYAVDADTVKPKSDWNSTTAKDTTLLFLVDPIKEVLGHVFWISAEDNDGKIDPTPAKRFFSAKTVPPTSVITKGPNAPGTIIGPNFTFEWAGTDPDGGETGGSAPVDSFEYLLLQVGANAEEGYRPLPVYDRTYYVNMINRATGLALPKDNPPPGGDHSDWKWVGIRGLRKRFVNVTPAHYVFAVRAVDIAGATEKGLEYGNNIRDFNVTNRNPGPQLCISSSVLAQPLPCTSGPEDIARRQIEIFFGETISFSWTANAETYGGEIVGFTYAMDDTAGAEWSSINILKTAVTFQPSQLQVGDHFLFVRVVDDGGLITNAKIPIKIVRPIFRDPPVGRPVVLLIDDFAAPPGTQTNNVLGSPNYPGDAVTDSWWLNHVQVPLAQEFGIQFRLKDTVEEGALTIEGRDVPTPSELSDIRTIIWVTDLNNSTSSPTGLWKTLVGGVYSELAGYLRAGGTLIITGFQVGSNTTAPTTTITSSFSRGMCATLDEGTREYNLSYFPRNFMGIDGAIASDQALRSNGSDDFVEARPTARGTAMGFQLAQVDTGGPGTGAKWNPYAFPGALIDPNQALSPGLNKIEGWKMQSNFACQPQQALFRREDPATPIAVPIYTYHGVPLGVAMNGGPSPRQGLVVGVATQAHDLGNAGGGVITPGNSSGAIGRMVFLGFPLYYIEDAQATAIMRAAFAYVNASPTLPGFTP